MTTAIVRTNIAIFNSGFEQTRGMPYTDDDAVNAVIRVIGRSRWGAVGIAHGFAAMRAGASDEDAARSIYKHGSQTLRKARDLLNAMKSARAQNGGRTTIRR